MKGATHVLRFFMLAAVVFAAPCSNAIDISGLKLDDPWVPMKLEGMFREPELKWPYPPFKCFDGPHKVCGGWWHLSPDILAQISLSEKNGKVDHVRVTVEQGQFDATIEYFKNTFGRPDTDFVAAPPAGRQRILTWKGIDNTLQATNIFLVPAWFDLLRTQQTE